MIIGIDFDNTIADYTRVFHSVALTLGWVPESIGTTKSDVKSYLIHEYSEEKWTELQGLVYGRDIHKARPYEHCFNVLKEMKRKGHTLKVVSHKTIHPVIGDKVNFHNAAFEWLEANKLINHHDSPLAREDIYFNETKDKKIDCIRSLGCQFFIDDLISIFEHKHFPENCEKILFTPSHDQSIDLVTSVHSWQEIAQIL